MLAMVGLYLVLGLGFGCWFIARGYAVLDPTAATATWLTRLLWVPAAILLWPVLLRLTMKRPAAELPS